jgi:hypothetical protein
VTPNITSVVSFGLDGGRIVTPYSQSFLLTDAGFELAGMAWLDGGINLVGDRTQVAKQSFPVHVLSASAGCELTEERPLFVPLGPVALAPVP